MPTRRFRPTFDNLARRLTPSDVAPLPVPAPPTAVVAEPDDMPGSNTTLDPGTWAPPTDVLHPTLDPTTWLPANQT
jgi:hypothetical protein